MAIVGPMMAITGGGENSFEELTYQASDNEDMTKKVWEHHLGVKPDIVVLYTDSESIPSSGYRSLSCMSIPERYGSGTYNHHAYISNDGALHNASNATCIVDENSVKIYPSTGSIAKFAEGVYHLYLVAMSIVGGGA